MNYDKLLESVKKHEGFRDTVYLDTLNKRTVGFGHLCVEDHWDCLLYTSDAADE